MSPLVARHREDTESVERASGVVRSLAKTPASTQKSFPRSINLVKMSAPPITFSYEPLLVSICQRCHYIHSQSLWHTPRLKIIAPKSKTNTHGEGWVRIIKIKNKTILPQRDHPRKDMKTSSEAAFSLLSARSITIKIDDASFCWIKCWSAAPYHSLPSSAGMTRMKRNFFQHIFILFSWWPSWWLDLMWSPKIQTVDLRSWHQISLWEGGKFGLRNDKIMSNIFQIASAKCVCVRVMTQKEL